MAEKEIAFKVTAETGQAVKTLGDLEKALEENKKEIKEISKDNSFENRLKSLNDTVKNTPINIRAMNKQIQDYQALALEAGRNTPIGKQALQEAANLRDRYVDIQNEVKRLSNDGIKMQAALDLGTSVIAGYSAFQGAMALTGIESEELQKTLVKLQGAQSLLMGVETIRKNLEKESTLVLIAKNSVEKISTFIKGESAVASTSLAAGETARATATAGATTATSVSTGALKLFRIALISTGIGAIIVGLGLLIANFESVSNWIRKVADNIYNIFKPQIDIVIGVLQYLGIVESEQARKTREATEEKARAYKQMVNQVAQELEREVKLQRKLTEEKIADMDYEIAKRQAMGEDTVEIEREKIVELMKLAKMELALTEEKIKAKQKELEATKGINSILIEGEIALYKSRAEEQGKSLKEIEQQLEIHDIKVRKSHMDEVKARQEANSKLSEEQKKEIAEREKNLKIKENLLNREFEAERKTAENIKGVRNNLATFDMDLYKKQNDLRVSLMEDGLKKELQLSQNAFLDRLATLEKEGILTNELKTKLFEEQAQREADIQKQFQQEEFNQRLQGAQDLSGALSDLNNAKLEADLQAANGNEREMEKIRKKAFARQKALDIVQATISGIKAVQSALTAPPPLGFALAGIVGATALANIKKIASTQFQGSGGGGSAPSSLGATASATNGADVGTVTNTSTVLGGDTKVFVTEQDISNTQNKVEVVESEATL